MAKEIFLIDTHSHLDFEDFDKDREEVIARAFDSGIKAIVNVGTNFESSKKSIALAEKYENIYASVSLHPIDVEREKFDEKEWVKLASHPKVVAIGETGFDFYHRSNRAKQKEIFEKLIKIACQVKKPLILHSREADEEILEVLKQNELSEKRGVIHCFGRSYEVAKKFLDLGFLISYTGNITYNKERVVSVSEVPLDKIMVETDCPFMAPVPFRGQRNEPLYVKYVAQKIAEIKNESFERVVEMTTGNVKRLFKIG
jgi:TatD DNase family protein